MDRVGSRIASATVAGVRTSAVAVFLLDMRRVFFPKTVKATKLFSGGRDLLRVEDSRILTQQIAGSAADSK